MPSAPGVSSEDAKKLKAKKDDAARRKKEKEQKYKDKVKTETVEELVDVAALEQEFFKQGDWGPSWANVEFACPGSLRGYFEAIPLADPQDGDACLKNVTKAGKTKDGFFVPAGTILPLGAALPEMTVLKYGGYFPAGTSFQGGVMIPLHARMVNLLPQETVNPMTAGTGESLCSIQ